jgi:hypothetical protein
VEKGKRHGAARRLAEVEAVADAERLGRFDLRILDASVPS